MINACIPLSQRYSPIAQPKYGARNCRGARSEAVVATIMQYSKAPTSKRILTNYLFLLFTLVDSCFL